jgi:TP901 family phage tail tape measure protein
MADNPLSVSSFFDPLGPGTTELQEFTAAIQALGRNYRTFAKNLEGDSQRVKALLDTLGTQAGQLRSQATDINLLNEKERAGMAALQAEAAKLVQERQRLESVLAAQAKAQRVIKDATTEATSALRAQQNELREAFKAGDTARIEKAALALRQTRAETQSLSAALRGANSEFSAAKGSYDALDAENKKLIASFKALEGGIGSGSGEALRLQKQIAANTETLKAFDENILVFNRNVGNYKGGFSGLIAELAKARAAQAAMTQGTAEAARQQMVVSGFQTAAQKSAAQMGLSYEQAEAKIEEATAALQPLATSLLRLEREQVQVAKTTGEESEQYRKLGFQIQQTKKQLDDVATATTQVDAKQQGLGEQLGLTRAGFQQYLTQLAVGYVGFQALAGAIQGVFTANVEYSRNLAEVRKTTGLTADEADRLAQSLKGLDTPTTLAGLLKIASVGGQLGVAKGELLGFTQAIDTAVQALSNDFTGGAEEIATVLGRIVSVYRKELGPDVAENILAVGSAINQISADGSATAPFLTDVAQRIGAIASSSKLGIANALAYAAVLQEQGFAAEVSGTALNRLFSTLSVKTKQAYEIARLANPALTLKEFTTLVNTDFNQAIQVFLKGLREGGKTTTDQARLLATLKLQSGEAKNAIVTLAQNTDLFAERQKTANTQLRDATSLAAEAAVNTDTLAGSVDKNTNAVKNFFTSGVGGSVLKFLIDVEAEMVKLVATPFKLVGDGFTYIGQKVGFIDKPLTDYTTSIVSSTLATRKQAAAQQELLKSYAALEGTTGRTAAQELELAKTRAELLKQFGTTDGATIQAGIDKRKAAAESNIEFFKNDIAQYDKLIAESQAKAAAAQNTLNTAPRNRDGGLTTRAGQDAVQALTVAEKNLLEQQRLRAQAVAALAKLQYQNNQAVKDGVPPLEEAAEAEEQLDRTAQERAKNRVSALRDELADNQKRLAALREYQTQQAKLQENGQITPEILAERVRGSEDLATQIQRDGAAIRIQIARAEARERLEEADNNRIRQSKKKDISERELADIQGQYAARRVEIARKENREIAQVQADLRKQLEVQPLEFKVAGLDPNALKKADEEIDGFLAKQEQAYQRIRTGIAGSETQANAELDRQLTQHEISQATYEQRRRDNRKRANDAILALDKQFHKSDGDDQAQANADELANELAHLERKREIVSQSFATLQGFSDTFFQVGSDFRAKELDDLQHSKAAELQVAGDNAALKAKIEEDYAARELAAKRKQAQYDKAQALFNVGLRTAQAVTSVLSTGGGTYFADFGISAGILTALVLAQGVAQAAAIAAKPLPNYFVGRKDGPAEFANLGEKGAELVGKPGSFRLVTQPSVGYLQAGDRVITAPETSQILAQNELVEGRLVQRQQNNALDTQTTKLRVLRTGQPYAQVVAEARAAQARDTDRIVKAIQEQEQLRMTEDGLQRWKQKGDTWTNTVRQRYKHGRG